MTNARHNMDFTFHPAVVVCFPEITESGFVEYHLVNARGWSNFDSVLQFLNDEFDAKVIEKFDGIWTRDYELDVKGTLIFFNIMKILVISIFRSRR